MTPKQTRFVEEYLVDLCATKAAVRAGYSTKTAEKIGSENIRKPEIAAAIAASKVERGNRTKVDADWVLHRLTGEAQADMADLYDSEGNLKPIREWPMVFRRGLVTGFETVQEWDGKGENATKLTVRKIKLQDRSKTVEMIGRHVDVQSFKDRAELVHKFDEMTDEELAARRDVLVAKVKGA